MAFPYSQTISGTSASALQLMSDSTADLIQKTHADLTWSIYADPSYQFTYTTSVRGGSDKGFAPNQFLTSSFGASHSLSQTSYRFATSLPIWNSEQMSYALYNIAMAYEYEDRKGDPNSRLSRYQLVEDGYIREAEAFSVSPAAGQRRLPFSAGGPAGRPNLWASGTGYEFPASGLNTSTEVFTFTGAGTITVTTDTLVTGTGTNFLDRKAGIRAGGAIRTAGGQVRVIVSVDSATQLTVDAAWGSGETGVAYYGLPILPGMPVQWGTDYVYPGINQTPGISPYSTYFVGYSGNGYRLFNTQASAVAGTGAIDFTSAGTGPHRLTTPETSATGQIHGNYYHQADDTDRLMTSALEAGYTKVPIVPGVQANYKNGGGSGFFGLTADTPSWLAPQFYSVSAVDASADTVTVTGWQTLAVGDVGSCYLTIGSGGAMPGGVLDGAHYFYRITANTSTTATLKLFNSASAAASNGTAVDITSTGTLPLNATPMGLMTAYPTEADALAGTNARAAHTRLTIASVDTGTGVITTTEAHGQTVGSGGVFSAYVLAQANGTAPGGVTLGTLYWFRPTGASTMTVFASQANAQANTSAIALSSGLTGTIRLVPQHLWSSLYVLYPRQIASIDTGTGTITFTGPHGLGAVGSTGLCKLMCNAGAGTVSISGTAITGTGTQFSSLFQAGDVLFTGTQALTIQTVTDNTNMVATAAGTTETGVLYWRSLGGTVRCAGTITTTNSSATVSGSGTNFNEIFSFGRQFKTAGNQLLTVASVSSDTSLQLTSGTGVTAESGVQFTEEVRGSGRSMYAYRVTAANAVQIYRRLADATAQTSSYQATFATALRGLAYLMPWGAINDTQASDGDMLYAAALYALAKERPTWTPSSVGSNGLRRRATEYVMGVLHTLMRTLNTGERVLVPSPLVSALAGIRYETSQQVNVDFSYILWSLLPIFKKLSNSLTAGHGLFQGQQVTIRNREAANSRTLPIGQLTGTATFTAGSTSVTGSGTQFSTECPAGTVIWTAGFQRLVVASVGGSTSLTLVSAPATTETGVAFYQANPLMTDGRTAFVEVVDATTVRLHTTLESAVGQGRGMGQIIDIPPNASSTQAVVTLIPVGHPVTPIDFYSISASADTLTCYSGISIPATAWDQIAETMAGLLAHSCELYSSCPAPLDFNSIDRSTGVMGQGVQARFGYDAFRCWIWALAQVVRAPGERISTGFTALAQKIIGWHDGVWAGSTATVLGSRSMPGGFNTNGTEYSSQDDARILCTLSYCALIGLARGRDAAWRFYQANIQGWISVNGVIGGDGQRSNDYLRGVHLLFLHALVADRYSCLN